jgi:hypothetical protein
VRICDSKNIKANFLLVLIGFIYWLSFGNAGSINNARAAQNQGELTASLDRNSVRIGDVVWLTLRYRLPEGASLQNPTKIDGIEGLTILEQIIEPDQIRIKLFVDRSESWQSAPLTVVFKNKEGVLQTLNTDPVSLTVRTVLGEKPVDAQLRPIQDIIPIKGFWSTHWPWAAGFVCFGLALTGAYLWYRKRGSRKISLDAMEPPHVSARKAIQELEDRKVFEKGEVKTFYFTISEIMRRYLESIRNFPAAEYTTEEISHRIETEVDRKLLPFLRQADLVKYADTVPTPARKEEDVRLALSYIDETCPISVDTENGKPQRQMVGGRR